MLATYNEAECVAVYHHCRSILSELPFSGGIENLAQLFVKKAVIVRHVKPYSKYTALKGKANVVMETQAFLLRFVHVHGVLFRMSTRAHQSYCHMLGSQSQSQSNSHSLSQHQQIWSNTSIPTNPIDTLSNNYNINHSNSNCSSNTNSNSESKSDTFMSLMRPVLEEFDDLLSTGALPDVMLVRLIVISIFSVHYAVGRDGNLLCWSGPSVSTKEGIEEYLQIHAGSPRTYSESLAIQALFGIINKYVQVIIISLFPAVIVVLLNFIMIIFIYLFIFILFIYFIFIYFKY